MWFTSCLHGGLAAQADWLGSKVGSRLALLCPSSREPGELSHCPWFCHYYYYYIDSEHHHEIERLEKTGRESTKLQNVILLSAHFQPIWEVKLQYRIQAHRFSLQFLLLFN